MKRAVQLLGNGYDFEGRYQIVFMEDKPVGSVLIGVHSGKPALFIVGGREETAHAGFESFAFGTNTNYGCAIFPDSSSGNKQARRKFLGLSVSDGGTDRAFKDRVKPEILNGLSAWNHAAQEYIVPDHSQRFERNTVCRLHVRLLVLTNAECQ